MSTVKEKVLASLLSADGAISGEEIANALGVSRNTVWKSIKSLKSDGYSIEGVSRVGYTIQSQSYVLSGEFIKKYLSELKNGKRISRNNEKYKIIVLSETDSTNNYAKKLALNEDAEGTVIISDYQSGGRGRRGRTFLSPKGNGLYMSVILKPFSDISDSIKITSFAAVAAARAIDAQTGASTKIKWVNDLFLGGRKICGILTEALMDYETMTPSYIILGIGINLRHTDFPPEIAKIATSLEDETGRVPNKNMLAAEILNNLTNLEEEIKSGAFLKESAARSIVIGKEITVMRGDGNYEATAIGLDKNGELIIKRKNENGSLSKNRCETLSSGEVSIRVKN